MDYNQRGVHPQQPNPAAAGGAASHHGGKQKQKKFGKFGIANLILLLAIAVLVAGVAAALAFGQVKSEESYVKEGSMQAVFLTNGQVYFGRVGSVNDEYLQLNDIYYLRVNQQVQPNSQQTSANDISLVKLGCELHGPFDEMVINRDQVSFWENLKEDGSVAKAVAQYKQQNPNGQKCETSTNTSNNNSETTPAPAPAPTPSPSTNKKP